MSLALKTYKPELHTNGVLGLFNCEGADYLAFMIRAYLVRRHESNFDEIDRKTLKFMISELRKEQKCLKTRESNFTPSQTKRFTAQQ